MTFDPYTYFEYIGSKLKAIGHTTQSPRVHKASNISELEGFMSAQKGTKYPAIIVIDDGSGRVGGVNEDGLSKNRFYSFIVIDAIAREGASKIAEKKKYTEQLADKIVSRMLKDARHGTNGFANYSLEADFDYSGLGPFADNLYGIMVHFVVQENFVWTINQDDWF